MLCEVSKYNCWLYVIAKPFLVYFYISYSPCLKKLLISKNDSTHALKKTDTKTKKVNQ